MTDTTTLPDGIARGEDLAVRWARTGGPGDPTRPHGPPRSVPRWMLVVVGGVMVALVALLVLAGLRIRHDDQLASARRSALAAATADAKLIATYSYASFDAYAAALKARSTATFASNFAKDSSSLGSVLKQYKAGSKGSTSGAGVGSVTTSKATVYVFLNETVSNVSNPSNTERARMVVSLVRNDGRWLIANAVVQ